MSYSEVWEVLLPPFLSPSKVPLLPDRMLVKVSTTKTQILSPNFDESIHRTTRDLQYQDWAEFMVVWRRDYIEIYEDYVSSTGRWNA